LIAAVFGGIRTLTLISAAEGRIEGLQAAANGANPARPGRHGGGTGFDEGDERIFFFVPRFKLLSKWKFPI